METARETAAFEAREALAQPGCAVCRLALRAVGRYIASVAYEGITDPDIRRDVREARGFCGPHTDRWIAESRSVLGTAIIYRDLLQTSLRDLEEGRRRPRGLFGRRAAPPAPRDCPACRTHGRAERLYLEGLLAALRSPEAQRELAAARDPVCLPHARAAAAEGGPAAALVVEHARAAVGRLLETLDEVIRKEDYRFRHEERSPEEQSAPARAAAWTAGASVRGAQP